MPVQFMHDGDEAVVTVDGRKHRFSIYGDVDDLEAYSYVGPADEAPDDVLEELEAHVQEHLANEDDEWGCDDCGETFESQQAYAAHHPCEAGKEG